MSRTRTGSPLVAPRVAAPRSAPGAVDPVGSSAQVGADAVRRSSPELPGWVGTFELFSDPTRIKILIAVHAAPDASVGELAAATDLATNTVTQALATLRAAGVVSVRKDGRFRRWTLTDDAAHQVLHHMNAPHSHLHPEH